MFSCIFLFWGNKVSHSCETAQKNSYVKVLKVSSLAVKSVQLSCFQTAKRKWVSLVFLSISVTNHYETKSDTGYFFAGFSLPRTQLMMFCLKSFWKSSVTDLTKPLLFRAADRGPQGENLKDFNNTSNSSLLDGLFLSLPNWNGLSGCQCEHASIKEKNMPLPTHGSHGTHRHYCMEFSSASISSSSVIRFHVWWQLQCPNRSGNRSHTGSCVLKPLQQPLWLYTIMKTRKGEYFTSWPTTPDKILWMFISIWSCEC